MTLPYLFSLYRTARLAQDICNDLQDSLVALCVLKGGYQFFTDLLDFIKTYHSTGGKSFRMQVDFIRLKSYVVSSVKTLSLSFCPHAFPE